MQVPVCGWLEKRGEDGYILSGSWIRRWFKSNNEYFNYYDMEDGELLGSYNLKKMQKVEKTGDMEFTITFRSGDEKRFRLQENDSRAQQQQNKSKIDAVEQWIKDLRERKEWFDDIWDATESEYKLNDANETKKKKEETKRQEMEQRKKLERRRAKVKNNSDSADRSASGRCCNLKAGLWIGATVVMVSAVVFGLLSSNGV
jgi:hypothetical protein